MNTKNIINNNWYHGSFDDIQKFHPFTHFGTKNAAQDRIKNKRIDDNIPENKSAFIYECQLSVESNQALKIKDDWGSHRAQSLARVLKDEYPDISAYKELWLEISYENSQKGKEAANTYGYPKLKSLLMRQGYKFIYYKNDVEDYGELSICIIDPDIISFKKI